AGAIQAAGREAVEIAGDLRTALEQLRKQEFTAVVIDESLLELSGGKLDVLLKKIEPALPVFINLGINRSDRVVRDVLTGIRRIGQQRNAALYVVQAELRSQLRSELTAILLTTEQLLLAPLPAPVEGKLRS